MTVATTLVGKDAKVTIGSDKILGMGTWKMSGVKTDLLESTEFGDSWKTFQVGLKDGGDISFNGFYDKLDVSGQNALRTANENNTQVTSVRFYVDNTSYYSPTTTNPLSYCYVTAYDVGADKAGLLTTSFTLKLSGKLELL